MAQTLKHKRSSVVSNGAPKLPTTDQIAVGEIAINFAEGYETLSTRNSSNHIATFSSDSVLDKKYISSGNVVTAISSLSGTIVENERVVAQAFNDQNDRIEALEDAGYISAYTETDPTVPSWAKQSSKPSYTASEVGALPTGATLDSVADGTTRKLSDYSLTGHTHSEYSSTGHSHTAAEVGALSTATTYFDDVEYDSSSKRINFKKNSTVIDYVDATDFIKDGMVSSVTVSNGNLVLTFNTDAGREDITLALTQIFNPNNYYDKTTADGKFLSGFTETDPTVPSWAKESTKPSYTASEVGAMATSERSNYLPTGTTLDSVADGTTRKLSDYSLTGHTHSEYASTGHSHTAAEVGAIPDTTDIPTEAKIANSGFTKNIGTLTGVTINGTPATVSNGVASANVSGLPTVSASDNGKILQVVNGQWTLVTPTVVYTGNGTPDNLLGNNGDIYLQTS